MNRFKHLLTSQLEQVGELVGASGLNPSDFEWRDASYRRYQTIPSLRHHPTKFQFQFTYSHRDNITGYGGPQEGGRHHAKFTPGRSEEWEEHFHLEWSEVLSYVEKWLGYVQRELGAQSFWTAVAQAQAGLLGYSEDPADEPFGENEIEDIKQALDDALERIQDLEDLRKSEAEFVRQEFEELKDSLRTLKRRGWARMALGTFINMTARDVVPEGAVRDAWQLLTESLAQIPGLLPPG